MNEETIIRTIPLRPGRRWEWFADCNVIGLAPGLTDTERQEAVTELQAEWRRSGLRLIPGAIAAVAAAATVAVGMLDLAPNALSHLGA